MVIWPTVALVSWTVSDSKPPLFLKRMVTSESALAGGEPLMVTVRLGMPSHVSPSVKGVRESFCGVMV